MTRFGATLLRLLLQSIIKRRLWSRPRGEPLIVPARLTMRLPTTEEGPLRFISEGMKEIDCDHPDYAYWLGFFDRHPEQRVALRRAWEQMTRFLVISPDGQVVGRIIEETRQIEATSEPLKALLARYEKVGAPMMIGDSNEEVAWDGFEFISPDDPRWFDTVIKDLRWKGYEFREVPEREGG
ncbi:MAG: hypothetical protein ACE5LG_01780 [Anaerolineae bacterium]